jgi:hypothetical protein
VLVHAVEAAAARGDDADELLVLVVELEDGPRLRVDVALDLAPDLRRGGGEGGAKQREKR